MVAIQMPVLKVDSPDDQWAAITSPESYPGGEFLAIAAWPCPAGRYARGGVGGQAITGCSICGHMSPSTAVERHVGPMLTPVMAYTSEVNGEPIVVFRRALTVEFAPAPTDGTGDR